MAIDENTFEETIAGSRGDANISHTKEHLSINSINVYEFMDFSYHGNGPYRDGRFLVPHTREMFYESRRELAFYKNFVKPITRATYQPVFGEMIPRVVDPETNMFSDFLNDVDNSNTGMQEYMERVIRLARLHGVAFVVMENFPAEFMPETLGAARESRVYPYLYTKKAQSVDDYNTDRFGNLEWIAFIDHIEKNNKGESVKIYRLWTTTETLLVKRKKNKDGTYSCTKDRDISKYEAVGPRNMHNLGVVPVIPVFSDRPEDPEIILADPPLYDIARINHSIYNKDSEIRDLERSQGFAVLVVQDDSSGNLTVGPNNVIFYPTASSNPPQYISPDSQILKGLVEDNNSLRDDLFRIAEQLGVSGVKTEASGIALGYKFYAQDAVLKYSSMLGKNTEEKIAELFKLYTGTDFEYNAEYPETFQPVNTGEETKELDGYLLQEGLTKEAKYSALKKYTRVVLGTIEPDELQDVLDSFDKALEEELKDEEFENDNPEPTPVGETGMPMNPEEEEDDESI